MKWNWQRPDWPDFSWNRALLRKAEERFLVGTGILAGALKHLRLPEQDELVIEAMTTEAIDTSAIEGETLDRASVQSSIATSPETNPPAPVAPYNGTEMPPARHRVLP